MTHCQHLLDASYVFTVAAGILPAVEPGILPGGMGVWLAEGTSISHLGSGRQDAALYGSQDGRCYRREPHASELRTGLKTLETVPIS